MSAAAPIIASKENKSAAKYAAGAEKEARDQALAYGKPSRDAGYQALAALMDMAGLKRPEAKERPAPYEIPDIRMGSTARQYYGAKKAEADLAADIPDMGSFEKYDWQKNDPGYAFRLEEGQRATENMLRSAGMLNSGKGLRAITRYGQDYASNEYDKAWGRLSAIAGVGGGSPGSGGSAPGIVQNYGTNIGQIGAAQRIGNANIWGGAITDAAQAVGTIFSFGAGGAAAGAGAAAGGARNTIPRG